VEPDPDPAIFVIDLQDSSKKQCCGSGSGIRCVFDPGIRNRFFPDPKTIFLVKSSISVTELLLLKAHIQHISKIKYQKESQNSWITDFSYYICLMIERSGTIPMTSGSGSGRPKPHGSDGSGFGKTSKDLNL